MTKHEAIKYEPGTPHPLAENYFALFLTIVKNFSIDDALIAMQLGSHSGTSTEVIASAIEENAVQESSQACADQVIWPLIRHADQGAAVSVKWLKTHLASFKCNQIADWLYTLTITRDNQQPKTANHWPVIFEICLFCFVIWGKYFLPCITDAFFEGRFFCC